MCSYWYALNRHRHRWFIVCTPSTRKWFCSLWLSGNLGCTIGIINNQHIDNYRYRNFISFNSDNTYSGIQQWDLILSDSIFCQFTSDFLSIQIHVAPCFPSESSYCNHINGFQGCRIKSVFFFCKPSIILDRRSLNRFNQDYQETMIIIWKCI